MPRRHRKAEPRSPKIQRPSGAVSGDGCGGGIVFHDRRPEWVCLNPAALKIFDLHRAGRSLPSIARALAVRHGLDVVTAAADARSTIAALAAKGFGRHPSSPPKRKPSLYKLNLLITERCNLACVHCHCEASPQRTLDLPTSKLLDLIAESVDLGAVGLDIGGGEPLLHPGLKEVFRFAGSKLALKLATNGTLIDDAWASFLAEFNPFVQISLDGPDAATHDAIRGRGAFAGALRAVSRLQKAGLADRLTLATAMQDANIDRLDDIIALVRRLGVPRLRFLPLRCAGRAARHWSRVRPQRLTAAYEKFFDSILTAPRLPGPGLEVSCGLSGYVPYWPEKAAADGFWCSVGSEVIVAADGNAYPCALMMEPPYVLGSVHQRSLASIVRSRPMARVCRILAERRTAIPGCAACLYNNFCQGGCMGLALEHKSNIFTPDDFCAYRKKAYRAAFDKILAAAAARTSPHVSD